MFSLPPLPAWNSIHPLIIHFPIALLLIVPVFVLIGVFVPRTKGRGFFLSALVLLVIGTLGTYLARLTGEAAAKAVEHSGQVKAVMELHDQLGETSSVVFTVLAIAFALLVLLPILRRRPLTRITGTVLPLVFLGFYSLGAVLLINTAHNGGRLVHELGVHALTPASPVSASAPVVAPADRDND